MNAAARALLAAIVVLAAAPAGAAPSRDEDPVKLLGASIPSMSGRPIAEIAVFRYDAGTAAFVPIPFQIDERVDHAFNPGTPAEVHELMYDVFGSEDGTLDADDELVVLFADGGPPAPAGTPWPAGADSARYEITVTDPRPDAPVAQRTLYVYSGSGLPHAPASYVTWSGSVGGDVTSPLSSIDFTDRWVLNAYRVMPPCGSGGDLIDRVKGRAGPNLGLESEQEWNLSSTYLGGRVGPIRAIRYVRGAASGTNTTHHDVIYRGFWERVVNLRVHAIGGVALYVDLLPRAGTKLYTSRTTAGADVDGVTDPGVAGAFVPWAVVNGPDGGYAVLFDVPPSPHYLSKLFYYRDDLAYNDAVSAFYDDEDNASYGAHGVELRDLDSTELDALTFTFRIYPLCAGVGDAALGAGYQGLADAPLGVASQAQTMVLAPVLSLRAARVASDVQLTWSALPGATGYRVYASAVASAPHGAWTALGDVASPAYLHAGAAAVPGLTYYSVVGLLGTQEGGW